MTINELNRTLEIMKEVYPFSDITSEIRVENDPRTSKQNIVCVKAWDFEHNTIVTLEREAEYASDS